MTRRCQALRLRLGRSIHQGLATPAAAILRVFAALEGQATWIKQRRLL